MDDRLILIKGSEDVNKQRLCCQLCMLGLVSLSVIALLEQFDYSNSKKHTVDTTTSKPIVYYSEELKESKRVVNDIVENKNTEFCNITSSVFAKKKTYSVPVCVEKESLETTSSLECVTYSYPTEIIPETCVVQDNSIYDSSSTVELINDTYDSLEIPNGDCSSFMFMDYRALTDISSKQWELQQYAYDGNYGIRMVDGCYCVATSSMYGDVGDKIRVTTDRGNTYWCIIADIKGYDSVGGWYHVNSQGAINLIEFVVDSDYIPNECWQMGDIGVIDDIGGNVTSIERIE